MIKRLNKLIEYNIKLLQKSLECVHNWIPHGYGYSCTKCQYYTGLNEYFNKTIEKQLKPK
jgi:hypothetical protein